MNLYNKIVNTDKGNQPRQINPTSQAGGFGSKDMRFPLSVFTPLPAGGDMRFGGIRPWL